MSSSEYAPRTSTVTGAFQASLRSGLLTRDPGQERAVAALQELQNTLHNGDRQADQRSGWLRRLTGRYNPGPRSAGGLYLYGPVGRGKSMLMDMFMETTSHPAARRVHFHEFMQDVHQRLHERRKDSNASDPDPLPKVAGAIASKTTLLAFDELQVTDVADAMILGRLFEQLFRHGVTIVTTSNQAPDELYRDGLQRERFLPCIALLKREMEVVDLGDGTDHRRDRLAEEEVYISPSGDDADRRLARMFTELTEGATGEPETLTFKGRRLNVPHAARGVAWFDFDDLCEKPLGAPDFLALARRYHTILISDIPVMGNDRRDAARRFVTLIDALYEHHVNLICSAEAPADMICTEGEIAEMFLRTASRLAEMQSADYIRMPHQATT